ncbi:Metallo-dependent phosphatase [Penicillium sp. IBT 18751x]|nr:Metallo-dependent phosphatase [Penicillium sp. IBT 18751x]
MTPTKAPAKIYPIKTFISELPRNHLPPSLQNYSENSPLNGRLIIIGDVHGMRKSLEALLDKINFDISKGDHLILTGDLVNKGPDSPGVVDVAMRLGASAVRGNHENAVLNAAAELNTTRGSLHSGSLTGSPITPDDPANDQPRDTIKESEVTAKSPPSSSHTTALAISKSQLDWLAALPLILRAKLSPTFTSSLGDTLLIVHAGLVPGIPPEEQDAHAIMHMRSLVRTPDEDAFIPAEMAGEESWIAEWDRWQDKLTSKTTVVFGHDAKRRLQLGKYAIGLDSGCLYGHQLSAL